MHSPLPLAVCRFHGRSGMKCNLFHQRSHRSKASADDRRPGQTQLPPHSQRFQQALHPPALRCGCQMPERSVHLPRGSPAHPAFQRSAVRMCCRCGCLFQSADKPCLSGRRKGYCKSSEMHDLRHLPRCFPLPCLQAVPLSALSLPRSHAQSVPAIHRAHAEYRFRAGCHGTGSAKEARSEVQSLPR